MQDSSISFWKRQRPWGETEHPNVAWRGERFSRGTTSNTHLYTHETVTKTKQLVERRPLRRKHQVQTDLNSYCDWFTELYRSCLFAFLFFYSSQGCLTDHMCVVISWVTCHWYSLESWHSIPLDPGLEAVMKKTDILQQHSSKVTICLT